MAKQSKKLELTRRDFIKTSTAAGTVVAFAPYERAFAQLHNAGAFWKRRASSPVAVTGSMRFDGSVSAYLSRTFAAPTSQTTWTWSGWVKRSAVGGGNNLLTVSGAGTGTTNTFTVICFDQISNGYFGIRQVNAVGTITAEKQTAMLLRDPSAWYHLMAVWDTTNSVVSERLRLYVNGQKVSFFAASTDPSASLASYLNTSGWAHYHGTSNVGGFGGFLDGYVAQTCFVDGQALGPSVFGATDVTTGQWVPKTNAQIRTGVGAWGNNGFLLPFNDAASITTLGYDRKTSDTATGGNNWTLNNFNTYDQVLDSPTNNFCTMNAVYTPTIMPLTAAGLSLSANNAGSAQGTLGFENQKIYFENYITYAATPSYPNGISLVSTNGRPAVGEFGASVSMYINASTTCMIQYKINNVTQSTVTLTNGTTLPIGTVCQVAYDGTSGKVWVGVNNSWYDSAGGTTGNPATGANPTFTISTTTTYTAGAVNYGTNVSNWQIMNMGQGGQSGLTFDSASGGRFKYTPPSGFKALCTANLPTPAIQMAKNYFFSDSYVSGASVISPAQSDFSGGDSTFNGHVGWSSNSFSVSGTFAGGGYANSWNPKFAVAAPFEVNFSESWPYSTDYCTSTFGFVYLSQATSWSTGSSMSATANPFWIYFYDSVGTIYENGNNMGNITITNPVKVKTNGSNKFEVYCNGVLTYTSTMSVPSEPMFVNFQIQYNSAAVVTRSGSYSGITMQTTNSLTTNFQPDLVWLKSRTATENHLVYDSVRGATKYLSTNNTAVESTDAQSLTAFTAGGATFGTSSLINGNALAAWAWKAGGAAVTNNAGSISAQVSANPTSGISIVTFTGTGANATVGHGLGVAPKMVICRRHDGTASSWVVGHSNLTNWSYYLVMNSTQTQNSLATIWNSTAPTSTVFSLGSQADVNAGGGLEFAYCFAEVSGFSKINSYVGNGSTDGPFVWCGFRPAFVMFKDITSAGHWYMMDTARETFNVMGNALEANLTNSEPGPGATFMDILSNGFKIRVAGGDRNTSGNTYIFIAFAEAPLKYANAR